MSQEIHERLKAELPKLDTRTVSEVTQLLEEELARRTKIADEPLVDAFANQKRRPGYWPDRLPAESEPAAEHEDEATDDV